MREDGGPIDHQPSTHGSPERAATVAALAAAAALLALVLWLWLRPPGRDDAPLRWDGFAPPAEVALRPWNAIVIHHSDSRRGTLESIDAWHRKKGWDGIGYHFVVGNGVDMPLGRVEATFRWRLQREGAHAGSGPAQTPFNQLGIGICLVGDCEHDALDPWQEARLADLCAELIRHVPSLGPARIIGHRDVPGKDTRCPGAKVDVERLRFLVRQRLQQ